jgi:hypothetical protein
MKIENVHVTTQSYSQSYCLSWDAKGARYHVWLNRETRGLQDNTLFKNPPLGVEHRGPGYFPTRRLDASKQSGTEMIALAWEAATTLDLFALAEKTCKIEQEQELARASENARVQRIRQAGPLLLVALQACLTAHPIMELNPAVRTALNSVEGTSTVEG